MEAGVAEECVTRMRVELNRRGFEVGDKKVRRMMGVMGIICIYL
ncbi:MAG: transposase [Bacteroidales bacterium]|nr:transposase [Clostridia bacterium]MBR3980304.1 transposase [Bacteroidales bacterium]